MEKAFKILLVDDDKALCIYIQKVIKKQKEFILEIANSYDTAMDLLKNNKYNLLITDYMLDKSTGLDLSSQAKIINPEIYIILISGVHERSFIVAALNEGIHSFISKPFYWNELLDKIFKHYFLFLQTESQRFSLNTVKKATSELIIYNDYEAIHIAVNWCLAELKGIVSDEKLKHIHIALLEALLNAFEHGNLGIDKNVKDDLLNKGLYDEKIKELCAIIGKEKTITINKHLENGIITFRIKDEGRGYVMDNTKSDESLLYSGRGLLIIKEVFDTMTVESNGTCIVMSKNIIA